MSEAERNLRKRIEDRAPIMQQHKSPSLEESRKQKQPPSGAPGGKMPSQKPVSHGGQSGAKDGGDENMATDTMETVVQATKEAPTQKRIRLTSSDGKQVRGLRFCQSWPKTTVRMFLTALREEDQSHGTAKPLRSPARPRLCPGLGPIAELKRPLTNE